MTAMDIVATTFGSEIGAAGVATVVSAYESSATAMEVTAGLEGL